jgi:outer membrane lipoprotein-sorting protein
MNKPRKFFAIGLLLIVAMLGLYGCGGSEPTPTPLPPTATPIPPTDTPMPPTPTVMAESGTSGGTGGLSGPAADLLNKSQTAMKSITSFHYTMMVESSAGGQTFTGEGDFVMPDKARITMSDTTGMVGKIEMIIIGNDTYMKQPGSEQYMSLGAVGGGLGSVAGLGNPSQSSSLAQFADSASIVGDENVDGLDTTHVTFTYDVDKAMQAAAQQAGSAGSAAATAAATPTNTKAKGDVWIDKSTNYIHKMVFVSKSNMPNPQANPVATGDSTITIIYSKYNEPVSPAIEKPANVVTLPGNVGTPVP